MTRDSSGATNGRPIPAWTDRDGRVWMDTGFIHRESKETVIELLNGQARGTVAWVEEEFGPLKQLGVVRE